MTRLNDDERRVWVLNDEGLYRWWQSSRQSIRAFIRHNRADLDAAILPVIDGSKPAHHLAYEPAVNTNARTTNH